MANPVRNGGLVPVAPVTPPRWYPITASYATALYIGDPVVRVAGGTIERATAAANNPILGCAGGFELKTTASAGPKNYFPASSSGTWWVQVYDDPDQLFEISEDGDTSDLAATSAGAAANVIAGTGSAYTGLSAFQIDSSSLGTSASLQLRLLQKVEDHVNAYGDDCRWIVKINYHQNGQGTVGAPV